MRLEFYCSMCGKEKTVAVKPEDGRVDAKRAVESIGWISQQNGEHFDIYCCKKCAA